MNRLLIVSVIFTVVLSACSTPGNPPTIPGVQPTMYPSPSIEDYFPLRKGAYWIYEGNVRWTVINSADVEENVVTWKMEVQRVFQRNNIVGYEMLGAPWDLAWYEGGKQPSEYGIIQAGGNFYRTSIDTVGRLMDESDVLRALVNENQVFLDVPLIQGKKFCDTFSLARSDGMYCWSVGKEIQLDEVSIKGVNPSYKLIEYPIYNGTMPDHSIIHFIPGVGVSHYEYHHHGTVSDVEVDLIEYYPGD
jgi:hypothetical protein